MASAASRNSKADDPDGPEGRDGAVSEKRLSVPDRIVQELVRAVHAGELVPGQRLVEADLVERFGVSRGPLREAFKRTAAMGLVEIAPHRGARIRQIGRREAVEKLVILEVLLGLAARLAAENIDTGRNRQHFARSAKRFMARRNRIGWFEFVSARDEFFRELIEIADNANLRDQIELVQLHLLRSLIKDIGESDRNKQYELHEKIIARIEAGDGAGAEKIMRQRVRAMIPLYENLPETPRIGAD